VTVGGEAGEDGIGKSNSFFARMWRAIQTFANRLYPIYIIAFLIYVSLDAWEFLSKHVEFLDGVLPKIPAFFVLIQNYLLALVGVFGIVVWFLWRSSVKAGQRLGYELDQARQQLTSEQSANALVITNLNRELTAAKDELVKYRGCEEAFARQSKENAECDKELFEKLFFAKFRGKDEEATNIKLAMPGIADNLRQVLDTACEIIQSQTGQRCNASIEIIKTNGADGNFSNFTLQSFQRDRNSRNARPAHDDVGLRVYENTWAMEPLSRQDGFYVNDNLAATPGYKDTRKDWRNFFNAILVVPIQTLHPTAVGFTPISPREFNYRGLFCIYSMAGGLDNSRCKHFIEELSWRVAVMLYRLDQLLKVPSIQPTQRTTP
jgi:hypothetical protein